jgi:hypothetical protein
MPRILTLDTEPETIAVLRAAGHEVAEGELGYRYYEGASRKGKPIERQPHPPHEFDVVVCDLRCAACYDSRKWGPGQNDNFNCTVEASPREGYTRSRDGELRPFFRLVHRGHIVKALPHSFTGAHVLTAIVEAGTQFVLFLNPEWIRHLNYEFPDWVGLGWGFAQTVANQVIGTSLLIKALPEYGSAFVPELPLKFQIVHGPSSPGDRYGPRCANPTTWGYEILATNVIKQVFGQVVTLGRGRVWLLPPFANNAAVLVSLLSDLDRLSGATEQGRQVEPAEMTEEVAQAPGPETRDVFISHASEDKDEIARPLADALQENGVTVWFDEFEMRLGDSLRRKIEEGLLVSRHGLTILSKAFFSKEWPQRELDALVGLESKDKRIMPVWHGLTAEEIRRYAPLIADKYAVSSEKGIDAIVAAVKRALM